MLCSTGRALSGRRRSAASGGTSALVLVVVVALEHQPQQRTMGVLLSIPLAGGLTTIGTSCLAGLAFCFTSTAGAIHTIPLH